MKTHSQHWNITHGDDDEWVSQLTGRAAKSHLSKQIIAWEMEWWLWRWMNMTCEMCCVEALFFALLWCVDFHARAACLPAVIVCVSRKPLNLDYLMKNCRLADCSNTPTRERELRGWSCSRGGSEAQRMCCVSAQRQAWECWYVCERWESEK